MPGRKQPKMTDNEKRREYRMMEKRHMGEGEIEMTGAAGEVQREREQWAREREMLRRHEI